MREIQSAEQVVILKQKDYEDWHKGVAANARKDEEIESLKSNLKDYGKLLGQRTERIWELEKEVSQLKEAARPVAHSSIECFKREVEEARRSRQEMADEAKALTGDLHAVEKELAHYKKQNAAFQDRINNQTALIGRILRDNEQLRNDNTKMLWGIPSE